MMERPHPPRTPCARRVRGFTLIELLVTIAIAAVLAAVAAPSVQSLVANNRLKTHSNAVQNSLMIARAEAIKRKARVVVCKSGDQASCTDTGDWQQGWIVFVDGNDSATVDAGETILEKVPAFTGSFVLKGDGNVVDYVSYTGTGAAKVKSSDVFQSGVMILCPTGGGDARQIEIFATGRLNVSRTTVTTCTAS